MTLTLGTATSGGGFPAYGEAAVREVDSTLTIEPRHTKGSAEAGLAQRLPQGRETAAADTAAAARASR